MAKLKTLSARGNVRPNQKELAQASNPGVLPFSVDAPETKTTCRLSPDGWARRAVSAYRRYRAERIVAEVNAVSN